MSTKTCIAAVVVTYNRKDLLLKCLHGIIQQTYKPTDVYIVDNASTDGTRDTLEANGFIDCDKKAKVLYDISFHYNKLDTNTGGAGGFYYGMKTAHETKRYDGLWVMDDDGIPEKDCLKYLVENLKKYDYIAPTIIAIENNNQIGFHYYGKLMTYDMFKTYAKDNIVFNYACPMNGILYSSKLLDVVGYPKPNLFIWGDEQNMNIRCVDAGFIPVTDIRAIHYHPQSKDVYAKSLFGKKIVFVPQLWKGYCQYRNTMYNYHSKLTVKAIISYYVIHMYYFLFVIHSFKWVKCFNDAFFAGFKKEPDQGYKKYMEY